MPVIEVAGLRKVYGELVAVHDISFTVEAGEVVAVLGPNGAGKTTTVEILEGYRARDAGEVAVLGMDPRGGGAELRRRIGIVLQEAGITSYLSVTEVVAMHAELYPAPRRVDEVVELVGLQEKAGARVKTLSGGQQRRLDLALGLVGDPELLFLDEPTTGFDPTARRQAWEVIRNLGSLGKTIVLTTHYMDEAQALADRVIVISAGRIVADGPPASIGGRADATVSIRFRLSAELAGRQPPVPVETTSAGELMVSTDDPTATLARLTTWALEGGGRLDGLTVERPTLEDVYLTLTAAATGSLTATGEEGPEPEVAG